MSNIERKYDLYSHDAKANAYQIFANMRRDDPVFCQPGIDGETMIWFVSRYEDVETVLRDDKHFVRDPNNARPPSHQRELSPLQVLLNSNMLNRDGADHRRLRNLVSQAFTPKQIKALQPKIETIANQLIDKVIEQGQMDLIADFAFHLPTIVILEMLGVPVADRESVKEWSSAFIAPALDPESLAVFEQKMTAFVSYLRQLFAQRRAQPQDDLVSALLQAEEGDDRLSEEELLGTMVLLIVAGHETTVNMIGNGLLALWDHPEQMQRLQAEPGLMQTAVEELIRYDGSVERALNRWVTQDVTLGGQELKQGDIVIVILGSANHDAAKFEQPENLNCSRNQNRHLGFGQGIHYCLGAPLARMEIEIALNTLLQRLPNLRPAIEPDQLRWRATPGFRGVTSLPVIW
jgi:cytochrome P450